jgi:hypothetical protein
MKNKFIAGFITSLIVFLVVGSGVSQTFAVTVGASLCVVAFIFIVAVIYLLILDALKHHD